MLVKEQFKDIFSEDNLRKIYNETIILSPAYGIDNISHKNFQKSIDTQISIISRKTISGSYKFTKYKLKLISKGREKPPREISIPTIRDRIALRGICDFLSARFHDSLNLYLPQTQIKHVKEAIGKTNYEGSFIKLDVINFYPTIKHSELFSRLRKRVQHPEIISLIQSAVETPTVQASLPTDKPNTRGIPQGLSISNILAGIYLSNLDKFYGEMVDADYFRYVDDILIIHSRSKSSDEIYRNISKRFTRLGLRTHQLNESEKSSSGSVQDRFSYLGYTFQNQSVSVRSASIDKLKASLVSIFTGYKHSKSRNIDFLLWRLNLRITGCVFKDMSKGWLFFFSEINDESLLHRLDNYIYRLLERFEVEIASKKFVRAYFQIKFRRFESSYIPNFDKYSVDQKANILSSCFRKNTEDMKPDEIEYEFNKRISRESKDLLIDIQPLNSSG